ncbi:MAG: hypothetical protein V1725_02505 [archaeon]
MDSKEKQKSTTWDLYQQEKRIPEHVGEVEFPTHDLEEDEEGLFDIILKSGEQVRATPHFYAGPYNLNQRKWELLQATEKHKRSHEVDHDEVYAWKEI